MAETTEDQIDFSRDGTRLSPVLRSRGVARGLAPARAALSTLRSLAIRVVACRHCFAAAAMLLPRLLLLPRAPIFWHF